MRAVPSITAISVIAVGTVARAEPAPTTRVADVLAGVVYPLGDRHVRDGVGGKVGARLTLRWDQIGLVIPLDVSYLPLAEVPGSFEGPVFGVDPMVRVRLVPQLAVAKQVDRVELALRIGGGIDYRLIAGGQTWAPAVESAVGAWMGDGSVRWGIELAICFGFFSEAPSANRNDDAKSGIADADLLIGARYVL